ncbi:MAG: glycosyltransferase family 4 protein [Planctomycetes bacterium]|nr:glycosyltransferase family 4 protein [Planctomycetota bacterium]
MNLLVLIDVFSFEPAGGAGTVLFETARALVRRGHRVRVVCRRRRDLGPREEVEGVRFHTWNGAGGRVRLALDALREPGRIARSLARDDRPDLVVAHHPLPLAAVDAAGLMRLPAVYDFHSPWGEEHRTRGGATALAWPRDACEAYAMRRASRVVFHSAYMAARACRRHGLRARRVRVIPAGVDLVRFRPALGADERRVLRGRLGCGDSDVLLVAVRSLIPRTGVEALVEALPRVLAAQPRLRVRLGGAGPLADRLAGRVRELGLEGRVRLAGFIPQAELADCYRAADLVVMPSEDLEGFGLVTLEAMACGTPVVATPVGANPEVLGGFAPEALLEAAGVEALSRGLSAWLREPARLEALRPRCRAWVEARHGWDRVAASLERVYAEAACASPT